MFFFAARNRHTGDTGADTGNNYYESRNRYSLSDVISHIKRSIPDLRNIKHHPLENKYSPPGSPRHQIGCDRHQPQRSFDNDNHMRVPHEKDSDALTLSAIQTINCTCGAKATDADPMIASDNKSSAKSDDVNYVPSPHAHSSADMKYC